MSHGVDDNYDEGDQEFGARRSYAAAGADRAIVVITIDCFSGWCGCQ